tara:strand:+ start:121 stop:453 length:333 start_codon:yes stop_codon:yes gene_type:complete
MEFIILDNESKYKKLTLQHNNKVVGRISVYFIKNDLHQQPYALLEDLYVEKEYRGQGFGKQLLTKALELAKEENCYKVIGTSRYQREKVHQFYQKFGFKDYGKEFRLDIE